MQSVRETLMRDWDPIGVAGIPEAADEYDSYIGLIYRILAESRSETELVDLLHRIETETMGLNPRARECLHEIARKLLVLDVKV